MPSSIKLTEPLDILVEYGYLDDDTPYHKALSNAVMDFAEDPTLGGEYNKDYVMLLQDEAKKELKLRRKKIDVKSFKEKFLNKKEEPVKADATGTSSIVPYKPPAPTPDLSLPEGEEQQQETEGLKGIRDILDEILKVLRLDFKSDRKEARDARKQAAKDKREKREGKLEGGGLKKSLGIIGNAVGAMLDPFKNIWSALIKFLKFTLLGVLLNDTLDWFKDPENQKKAKRIGKFFKDWWPALATAAALWLTPLGGLLAGVTGLLTAIIPKLVIAIAANPWAALALVGTGLAIWGVTSLAKNLGGDKEGENLAEAQNQSSAQLQDEGMDAGDAEVLSQSVTTSNTERMTQGDTNIRSNTNILQTGMNDPLGGNSMGRFNFNEGGLVQSTQNYNEGGLVQHYNDQKSAQNFVQKYNQGGLVNTYNQSGLVQKYNQGGLVNTYNQGSLVQKYNQGGLVNTYNQGGLVQKYNQGGLVQNYQNFKGGGLVETYNNLTKIKNYKQGGFVSGPGGVDKVPARLTAGEFVMSKGAVQKFGVNTLSSMNASGGGTNVPTITQEFNQGGVVQYLENGGVVGDVTKEPVGTPIVQSTNRTITLPTIPKQQQGQKVEMGENDIPDFRIPIVSSQRSMVIASLGIKDLVGG